MVLFRREISGKSGPVLGCCEVSAFVNALMLVLPVREFARSGCLRRFLRIAVFERARGRTAVAAPAILGELSAFSLALLQRRGTSGAPVPRWWKCSDRAGSPVILTGTLGAVTTTSCPARALPKTQKLAFGRSMDPAHVCGRRAFRASDRFGSRTAWSHGGCLRRVIPTSRLPDSNSC